MSFVQVGLLHSLSGTMAISEAPLIEAQLMAIAEINETGGVLGKLIEPVIKDGASDPAQFQAQARKLIEQSQITTVFGCWTSVSRKAVLPVVEELNAQLWYPVQYEGLESSKNIFYTGSCPNQQVEPAVTWLLQNKGTRFYLLGSDYVFPRTVNKIIKAQLKHQGGTVVGEEYVPSGTRKLAEIINRIQQARPDVVFNTLNGDSNLTFYHQYEEAGITAQEIPVLAVSIAEVELQRIGDAATGHYASRSYFQSLDTPSNRRFVQNFQRRYGQDRVTSDPIEAAYTQVYLWKQAVEQAQSFEVDRVRVAAYGQSFEAPSGFVRIEPNHHVWKSCRIGKILPTGQFETVYTSDNPIKPLPWLGVEEVKFNTSEIVIDMLAEVPQGIHKAWQLEQKSRELKAAKVQLQREIIQRQRVEAVLSDSEAQLQALFAAMTDVVLVFNAQGRYLKIAPTNPRLLYKSADELIGKTLHEVFEREQADTFLGYIRQALDTQQTVNVEYSRPTIEGQKVWLTTSISPLSADSVIWVARDITATKRTEEALRESEARFRAAAEGSHDAFFIFESLRDGTGRIIDFTFADLNSKGEKMISMSKEEAIGKRMCDILPINRTDGFFEKYVRVVETGIVLEEEFPISTPEVTALWLHHQVVPLRDGIAITSRDITERKQSEQALRESETRLRLALESAQMGTWDWNILTNNIVYSDQLGPVFGLPRGTYHPNYEAFLNSVHPEDREFVNQAVTRAVKQGADYAIEFRVFWPDGTLHWVGNKGQVYYDETGSPVRMIGVAMNITERKEATEALRQSEERMRALLNAIPDPMYRHRVDGTYLDVKTIEENLLLPSETLIGKNLRDLSMPEEVKKQLLTLLEIAVKTGELQTYEHDLEKLDGVHSFEARFVKSGVDEAVCIVRDITERKQAEAALREAQERYHSIFENSDEGLFQATPGWRYLSANPALARIYGYKSPEELIANLTNINEIYVDDHRREQFLALIQAQDTVSNFESQVYRTDGSIIWVSENTHVVCDAEGELLYYEGSVVDITVRKVWEEALRYQQECTEDLLLNILPEPIAQRLKQAESTIADSFAEVTVLFADLVNFTEFSAQIPPTKLVELLNKIFSEFDQLAQKHGLEKIKTIGDAYMVVGGLPTPKADHAEAIAEMALDMQQGIDRFKQDNGQPFRLRIGIHTGPVVAGVIGIKKFSYDLWGDTVNVASRMESQGVAGSIQVTAATYELLKDKYLFERRGATFVKGKGEMITYWLIGRRICHLPA
ncbi:MAG TPA: urea ABC transporter substrate-binding protein [Coleofasciculaceae cyanobacterium]